MVSPFRSRCGLSAHERQSCTYPVSAVPEHRAVLTRPLLYHRPGSPAHEASGGPAEHTQNGPGNSTPGPSSCSSRVNRRYSVARAVASGVAAVSGAVTGAAGVEATVVAAATGATRVAVLFGARLRSFGTLTIVRRQRVQM